MNEPLASLMRPQTLDDIIGQEHILSDGKLLRRIIESDMLSSIILYGPPGTGKTTIAHVISKTTCANFIEVNATTGSKKDLENAVKIAKTDLEENNKKTILFIDEIHRFNKSQQDFLLPHVEKGIITLIGATTENPYFEVNGALLSRSQIFELKPLTSEHIEKILSNICDKLNEEKLINNDCILINLNPEAKTQLASISNGDARTAINALDLAIRTTPNDGKYINITTDIVAECIQKKIKQYDKNGDNHYDAISAFIESIKHNEIDAALCYLAYMIDRGEDPKYIARRLFVISYRDVGLADPNAINIAASTFQAVEKVGLPECADALAMCTVYMATAPKTHQLPIAFETITDIINTNPEIHIPFMLKDESYKSAGKLKHGGVTDVFATGSFVYDGLDCMPNALRGQEFFKSDTTGYGEYIKKVQDWQKQWHETYGRLYIEDPI